MDKERKDDRYRYKVEIQQMMFVSGDTNDPPLETTQLIEDIVRSQVVEILVQGMAIARKRGARSVAVEDLIFQIRHDKAKVNRLITYLSWKEVRKNAKDQDGVAEGDILEDTATGEVGGADSSRRLFRKMKIRLPWEMAFMFPEQPLEGDNEEEGEDEEEMEAHYATRERLKMADERTRDMSKEEYVHWSECRQASFTFRKSKRFREWCGIQHLTDTRPTDDILDILGFLTFEIVANLTERALKIKAREEALESRYGGADPTQKSRKRKRDHRLFDGPDERKRPILARHIREAYRQYQESNPKARALRAYTGGLVSTKTAVI